ncbi:Peroxisomal acyl-coenzyme A oxidase 1 [Sphaceloma murrayae]|uniref:Acyl-coenzyme A oxidase n=1 Tax=Sphaceloma murrayae TaxID=2082308 RepID=A0A2K1QZU8_9PEZI|nr:Peroxisomal acyl-coenzyme A oxidase 1 [Sphaceloma murrayae]
MSDSTTNSQGFIESLKGDVDDFTSHLKPTGPDGPVILADLRSNSNVQPQELSQHLLGQHGFLERQDRILGVLLKEPLLRKRKQSHISRPERYWLGLARAKLLRRLSIKHGWEREDDKMAMYLVDDVSPYTLHYEMFITTVREQGNDEQRAYWMPKIESWDIIGAYAQSELGHGSNVRGLECEARWEPKTKQFILHSPTLTASKWWNGSLGRTANHAIVIAQLLLPDRSGMYKSLGPHPFIVQIRDMKTHKPLNGIVVGDIGPKIGYKSMDNCYCLFKHHAIPHSAMLARYSKVDPETGEYSKPENPAVVYGSLTAVRANIVMHARLILARAVTVAIRYTSVRRQFQDRDAKGEEVEMAVIDYPTVQIRILPLLATTFALHYTGQAMQDLYNRTRASIESGDFSSLAELHSTSSGLKSLCTELAANGTETCRRALGGHGFSEASGLVQLKNDYLSKPTVEGDNWMITQQCSSYLIKQMTAAIAHSASTPREPFQQSCRRYLATRARHRHLLVLKEDGAIVEAFERRSMHLTHQAYTQRIVQKRPWNSLMILLRKQSIAHSQWLLVSNFYNSFNDDALRSQPLRHILRLLFRLFALHTMDEHAREFAQAKAVSDVDLDSLPDVVLDLMGRIRPHAVNLVDAWSIPDYLLDSALGRYDGRVYEDLFHRAHRLNPLNDVTVNPDWRTEEIVMGAGPELIEEIAAKL